MFGTKPKQRATRPSRATEPPQAAQLFLVHTLLVGELACLAAILCDTLFLNGGLWHWTMMGTDAALIAATCTVTLLLRRSMNKERKAKEDAKAAPKNGAAAIA